MKVAIFIKNNEITFLHEENVHVVIFNMEDDKVVGVQHTVLEKQTNDSIISWLNLNCINQIYISEIEDQIHQKINTKGIQVKTIESLENDKLYNTLALSS